jgi:hypothetical protein
MKSWSWTVRLIGAAEASSDHEFIPRLELLLPQRRFRRSADCPRAGASNWSTPPNLPSLALASGRFWARTDHNRRIV